MVISLHITTISSAPLSINIPISLSIRALPSTSTRGFGNSIPSAASRLPSPAAIIAYFIFLPILAAKLIKNYESAKKMLLFFAIIVAFFAILATFFINANRWYSRPNQPLPC